MRMDWWVTACAVDMVVLRLRRDCPSAGPYVAWVGDLIDIRTDETRRQLAAVLDLHWRPVPGFASGVHHDAALATAALLHAAAVLRRRRAGMIFTATKAGRTPGRIFAKQ